MASAQSEAPGGLCGLVSCRPLAAATAITDRPARVLGTGSATSVVVGAIIGVGIFFTPAKVARLAGSGEAALLVWTLAGVVAMLGALTFAELGAMYRRNGGQYQILRDAYGPAPAFLFVFCNSTAIQAGAVGIIGLICVKHIGLAASGQEPSGPALLAMTTGLIGTIALANVLGARTGALIQNATVVAKVLALLAITGVAVATAPAEPGHGGSPAGSSPTLIAGVLAAMVPAFFSYGGWQHALWIGGEVRRAARTVPLAVVGGVAIVVAVYVAANWAYLRLLGFDGVAATETIAADAVGHAFPGPGSRVVAGAVAISAFGVLNAQLLSGPRLVYGMARDGRFFAVFGRLSRWGTPVAAISLIGGLGAVLIWTAGSEGVDRLLTGVVLIDAVFFALTGAALLVLRRRRPTARRPVRVPGYPWVPALFVLAEVGVITGAFLDQSTQDAAVIGIGWILAAMIVYFFVFSSRNPARN